MSPQVLLATAVLSAATTPALATGVLTLQGSRAVITVEAFVGTAIVDARLPCVFEDTVEECDYDGLLALPEAQTTRSMPGVSGIAGSGWALAEESQWGARMALTWSTGQQFALTTEGDATVLSASGRHDSLMEGSVAGPGAVKSQLATVRNYQRIGFSLDRTTDFTMSGQVFGEYMPIQLYQTDPGGALQLIGSWCPYQGIACEASGTLAAGDYQAQVFEFVNSHDQDAYSFGWDYRITFADTVSAVPEPGTVALFAVGLAAVGARLRRRRA
jgi:hypothetical protein